MRTSIILTVPAILLLVVVIASPGKAAKFPYPTVGYSADVRMDMGKDPDGRPIILTGKVYFSGDKERRETVGFGQKSIIIWRRDKNITWTLIPDRKIYMERRGADEKHNPERMMREGNVTITKVGSETVNGMATTKYKIEGVNERGHRFEGFLWATNDDVPARMEGTSKGKRVRIDYTNIKTGKQDPALFRVPADYQLVASPGMPGWGPTGVEPKGQMPQMPQSRPPGMTKDQWEQMKKLMEQMQKQHGGGK
jgi:hypothetical protein